MSPKFAISSLVASAIIGAAALTAPSAGAADASESPVSARKVGNQCEVDIDETHLIKDISQVFAVSLTYSPIKDSLNEWLRKNEFAKQTGFYSDPPFPNDALVANDPNFKFNSATRGQSRVSILSNWLLHRHADVPVDGGFSGGAMLIASGGLATNLKYPLWEHYSSNSANGTDPYDDKIRPIDRAAIQLDLGSVVDANGQPADTAIKEQEKVINHLQHLYSYYLIEMFTADGRSDKPLVTSEFLDVFRDFENNPVNRDLINNFLEDYGLVDSSGQPTMKHVVAACQEAFGVTPTSTPTSSPAAPTSTSKAAPSTTSTKTTTSSTSTTSGPVSSWVNPNQPSSTTSKTTTSTSAKPSTTTTTSKTSTTSTTTKSSTTSTSAQPSTTTTTSKTSTTSSTANSSTTSTSESSTTSEKITTSTSETTSNNETTSTTAGVFEPVETSVTDPTSTTTTGNDGSGSGSGNSTTTAKPGESSSDPVTSEGNNGGSTTTTTPVTTTSNREIGNGGSNVAYNTTTQTSVPSEGADDNGRWGSSGNKADQQGSGSSGSSTDTLPMIAALAVIFGLGGIFAFFYSFLHNSGVSLTFLR